MDPEESSIERLKRTLYSRNEELVPKEKMTPVSPHENDVPTSWGDKPNYDISPEVFVKKNNSFFNKYLIVSLTFFVLSVGVAVFIFFGGINTISSNNISVDIVAPTSISSGEELSVGLSIVNGNRTDLSDVKLFIKYPSGAESALEEGKSISQEEVSLGVIEKGGTTNHSLAVILFGEKDSVKSFNFRIEYKVKGSNAVFSKEKNYDILIGSSPILLEVKYPKEVNSGQDLTLSIEVTSNSTVPIQNTLIKVEYPYGFTYKSSSMNPVRDNSVWNIGDLKNGDKKKIDIVGTLVGQNLEDRSFRISAGTKSGSVYDFDTPLVSSLITLGIRKSFFDLSISTANKNIGQVGRSNSTNIRWQNTLPDKIINGVIEVKLSGNAIDRNKVELSSGGFYRSVDNTVIWDKNNTDSLIEMSPGDSGQVNISVASLINLVQPKLIKNPHIALSIKMTGERSGTDGGEVSSIEDFIIKIQSVINITSKTFRDSGPFTNIGPIPPKADKESTYTINWVVTNTTSDLKNAQVRAVLPQGVSWKGEVSPQNEKINFDPDSRVIVWDIGNISAGTGFVYSAKQVYFKVSIIPSVSQINTAPKLVSQAKVTSTDTYTESMLDSTSEPSSTLYSDSSFVMGKDIVGP